jgi:hypothetical protein
MLNPHRDKMLRPSATKAVGPPAPDAPRGTCPGCGVSGPLVVDRSGSRPRVIVAGCRCGRAPR